MAFNTLTGISVGADLSAFGDCSRYLASCVNRHCLPSTLLRIWHTCMPVQAKNKYIKDLVVFLSNMTK